MTAWRRLRAWQQVGVWARLHELLLAELLARRSAWVGARDRRLQPRAGKKGGAKTGPSPVDRGRQHHLLVDGGGVPLAWTLTDGHRNDVTQLLALLDRVPTVRGRVGRPRRRPRTLIADRGYDHDEYRRLVWQRLPGTSRQGATCRGQRQRLAISTEMRRRRTQPLRVARTILRRSRRPVRSRALPQAGSIPPRRARRRARPLRAVCAS